MLNQFNRSSQIVTSKHLVILTYTDLVILTNRAPKIGIWNNFISAKIAK